MSGYMQKRRQKGSLTDVMQKKTEDMNENLKPNALVHFGCEMKCLISKESYVESFDQVNSV